MSHPDDTIPYGFCHCGCGERTEISKKQCPQLGHIKGQPVPYVIGHSQRKSPVEWVEEDRGYKTPCWVWQRATTKGYGNISIDGTPRYAHRVYYERAHGAIPVGFEVDHLCRVRSCVNPDHLEAVPRIVNLRRRIDLKMSMELAAEMRALHEQGWKFTQLAQRFGVCPKIASHICRYLSWIPD